MFAHYVHCDDDEIKSISFLILIIYLFQMTLKLQVPQHFLQ